MVVAQVLLHQFRYFSYSHFNFNPETNLLVGCNGSGKTSILEALYFLAYAKSFRSRYANTLITHQASRFQIDAKILMDEQSHVVQTAYGNHKADCLLKMDHDSSTKQSDLAKMLPVVFIDTSTHREFSQTPKNRRDYLNWCCFYTDSDYHQNLGKYQRVLQQRNQLLKQAKMLGPSLRSQLSTWTEPLVYYAHKVDESRRHIIQALNEKMITLWPQFFSFQPAQLDYHPGWKPEHPYADCLEKSLAQDIQYGYTQCGPHRADLLCMTNDGAPLFGTFSQGQQKLFSYLLRFIQLDLVAQSNRQHRILLIDDLAAELDIINQEKILDYLSGVHCQQFITALSAQVFDKKFSNQAIFVDAQPTPADAVSPAAYTADTLA